MSTTFDSTRISLGAFAQRLESGMYDGSAVMIIGSPGIGKTEIPLAITRRRQAADPDFGGCYLNFGNMQTPDIIGWPIPGAGPLSQNGVPEALQPVPHYGLRGAFPALCPDALRHATDKRVSVAVDDWYNGALQHSALVPYSRGIWICDEATKVASEGEVATLARIGREGRTGQWGVNKEGWVRLFMGNRQKDGSRDQQFPAHFINDTACFEVYQTWDDVAPYWRAIGMHEDFIAFAASEPTLVMSAETPLNGTAFSTPRSWVRAWTECMKYCNKVLGIDNANAHDPSLPYAPIRLPVFGADDPDPEMVEITNGFKATIASRCGEKPAMRFADFVLHLNERPTVEEILADPTGAHIPDHIGVQHATSEMLIGRLKLGEVGAGSRYMARMPKVMGSIFVGQMARKHGIGLVNDAEFNKLIDKIGHSARVSLYS